jgi:hypothetical protein
MSDTISPRRAIAEEFAQFVRDNELCNPFGGDVTPQGRYYGILFSRPRTLDGLVQLYGPAFIRLTMQGPLVRGSFDAVYGSKDAALRVLKAVAVDFDLDAAHAVPVKPKKAS